MLELWGQATKCFEVQILFMLINNVDLIIKISTHLSIFTFLQCPMWKLASIQAGATSVVVVNTTYPTQFELKQNDFTVCK